MILKDYRCGLCGEEFRSNCDAGDIACPVCEARLCPGCGAWFNEDGDSSQHLDATAAEPQTAPEDADEYLSAITGILSVFDDDPEMTEHLLAGRCGTPEGMALAKIREIGRTVMEGRAPSLRAILAEVLDSYGPSGSAHVSRVSRVTVIRWRMRAGLPVTDQERKMAGG